jgi:hypothetical protein
MYGDTPLPQEEPVGENPPDGAIIDYYLPKKADDISLEIYSTMGGPPGTNALIRKFSNMDTLYTTGALNIPFYWIRPQQILSTGEGHHRFLWDMKYTPLNIPPSYPIGANYMNTAPGQTAPWVMPGQYKVVLTVDGKRYENMITVRMDPRVTTPAKELSRQFQLSLECYEGRKTCMRMLDSLRMFRAMLHSNMTNAPLTVAHDLGIKDETARKLEGSRQGSEWSFQRLNNGYTQLFSALQDSDMPPTMQVVNGVKELRSQLDLLLQKWKDVTKK